MTFFIDLGYITKPQDMDQYVTSAEDGSYYCGICNQASRKKDNLPSFLQDFKALFVCSIDGPKQNATSLLTPVSIIVFYALSSGTLGFALHVR